MACHRILNIVPVCCIADLYRIQFIHPYACMHACMHVKSLQSCPTLCNPMDSSPPGSSVHRILQARVLDPLFIYLFGSFKPSFILPVTKTYM